MDDNGEYTKVVAAFRTAIGTGSKTPTGVFSIGGKQRWHVYSTGAAIPYASSYYGGLYIHGPIYDGTDNHKMYNNTYNEIGTQATSGCLRTTTYAAYWIYNNCPRGTTVEIVNGAPKGTSSDAPPAIVTSGVDPTDPEA